MYIYNKMESFQFDHKFFWGPAWKFSTDIILIFKFLEYILVLFFVHNF